MGRPTANNGKYPRKKYLQRWMREWKENEDDHNSYRFPSRKGNRFNGPMQNFGPRKAIFADLLSLSADFSHFVFRDNGLEDLGTKTTILIKVFRNSFSSPDPSLFREKVC